MDHEVSLIGQVLDGRYRVEEKIGEGGMGVVLAARHIGLGQRVAIKLMRPDAEPVWRRRFVREARAASRIESDHVARVFDVGLTADGTPFLTMEYLEGRDLAAVLAEEGALTVTDALTYAIHACRALEAAHQLGIVHRDVKPANLFLSRRDDGSPCIKLLDFGISKQDAEVGTLTGTHAVLGSPQFMSPEQLASCRDVDARADVWSLGATLFELLTLEHAFEGASLAELCTAIMRDEPRRLSDHRPDAPPELGMVIERCLQKRAELRFPSASELEEHLSGLRDLPPSLRPTLPAPAPSVAAPSSTIVMSSPELLEDQTPLPSVRPVTWGVTPAQPRPRPTRTMRTYRLAVASFVGLLGFALALEEPNPAPITNTAPSPPAEVVAQAPQTTLAPPDEEHEEPDVVAEAAPSHMAPSNFSDSGLLSARHRRAIENELARARASLQAQRIDEARSHVNTALGRLRGVGIRPNEGVSSLGARISLLRGEIEGAALHRLLADPIRRSEAKTFVPKLEHQLMLAHVAYQHVRGWGVASLYRCAVVEAAELQLAVGGAFARARDGAHSEEDSTWMVKAAAAWLRKAQRDFRMALRVPAETTLCLAEAKQGLRDTAKLSKSLSK